MSVQVLLVDINPRMIDAWRDVFAEHPEVQVVHGSMLDQAVDAWVTPTNAKGHMDGGLDAIIKKYLGDAIEKRVQQEIHKLYGGSMLVGYATCVPTDRPQPRHLISTATMQTSSQDISASLNVALACAAAFQMVHMQNARAPGSIASVALPGLGANTGKVPVEICADLMWTGYNLFRAEQCPSFAAMRTALTAELGELEPSSAAPTKAAPASPAVPGKKQDIDFDDAE